jgi:hypothetical protein
MHLCRNFASLVSTVSLLTAVAGGIVLSQASAEASTVSHTTTHTLSHGLSAPCTALRRALGKPDANCASFVKISKGASTLAAAKASASSGITPDCSIPGEVDTCTATVSPRVTCGGFNGHIIWDTAAFAPNGEYYVEIYGEVWSTCNSTSYVYLAWDSPTYHNADDGNAGPYRTTGVLTTHGGLLKGAGYISVDVCNTYNGGWHCGATQDV